MKTLLLLLSVLTISCNSLEFKLNDCIQKPDENIIWKIVELKDKEATLIQSAENAPEIAKPVTLNSSWIKAKCRN